MKRYKDYAVTYLTGEYVIENPIEQKVFDTDESESMKVDIEKNCDWNLVKALQKAGIEEEFVEEMVNASRGDK